MATTPPARDPGFAPRDLTDGRPVGEYRTRYSDGRARWGIFGEAVYLGIVLLAVPILMAVIYLRLSRFPLSTQQYAVISHYAYAWLGGTLGGSLYSIKWLYHSVGHGTWNEDRRLWRVFTPHLSAGLAFAVAVLVDGHTINIFDARVVSDPRTVVGLSFLVGYFSDSVVAKLAEFAESIFGSHRRSGGRTHDDAATNPVHGAAAQADSRP